MSGLLNWGSGGGAEEAAATPSSAARGSGVRKKSKSASKRAGLTFPVARFARRLREGRFARRLSSGAPVYLAAALEYLTSELLDLAGNAARDNKLVRIIPRHIVLAARNDMEFDSFLGCTTILGGGVLPVGPHNALKKKKGKGKGKQAATTEAVPASDESGAAPLAEEATLPLKKAKKAKKVKKKKLAAA